MKNQLTDGQPMSEIDPNRTFDRALLAGVGLAVALLVASVLVNRSQARLMRSLVSESAFVHGSERSGIAQTLLEERLARSEKIYRRASLWNSAITSLGLVTVGLFALALQLPAQSPSHEA